MEKDTNKKHQHIFLHSDYGCYLEKGKVIECNDEFVCECGEKITVRSNEEDHHKLAGFSITKITK